MNVCEHIIHIFWRDRRQQSLQPDKRDLVCSGKHRPDEKRKQFPHTWRSKKHGFRMPLNAKCKRLSFDFNCLNCAIRSVCTCMDIFSEQMNGLMVETIGIQSVSGQFMKMAVFGDENLVPHIAAVLWGLHMQKRISGLTGKILVDTSATGGVEHLHTPADADYRKMTF